jgi:hypothetical protein
MKSDLSFRSLTHPQDDLNPQSNFENDSELFSQVEWAEERCLISRLRFEPAFIPVDEDLLASSRLCALALISSPLHTTSPSRTDPATGFRTSAPCCQAISM